MRKQCNRGRSLLLLLLILLLFNREPAEAVVNPVQMKSYRVAVDLDINAKSIQVEMEIAFDVSAVSAEENGHLTFLLNKNALLQQLRWNDRSVAYSFDTQGISPNRYLPDARTLTVQTPDCKPGLQKLNLRYTCRLNELKHRGCLFEEKWIELNSYSTWFPINYDYGGFTCRVNITIDPRYRMSGSGDMSGSNGNWQLMRNTTDTEIVLIASPELQTRQSETNGRVIRVDSIQLSDVEAENMLAACRDTFSRFEKWFGRIEGGNLTLTLNPTRNVTSYARRGFISLQTQGSTERELYNTIGHEIGHFWWRHAVSSATWEDWLNESFAEYASLINSREKYGNPSFLEKIEEYRKLAADLPPLWEIDRGGGRGATTLYRKGPLILYDLDQKLGHESFLRLLQKITTRKIATTADLLALIEMQTSTETRRGLENALKK